MTLAYLSLAALVLTLVVSCTTAVNPGVLAIVLAWVLGAYVAPAFGAAIGPAKVMALFPSDLFLTLVGVTLLFAQAQANGTLEHVARASARACGGRVGMLPLMFFALALGLASIGAGNIAAAALVAPTAMAVASRAGIPPLLMTIMVAHGAIAGALSPVAPTGIIAAGLLESLGMGNRRWEIYTENLLANLLVACAGYLLLGGWRLLGQREKRETSDELDARPSDRLQMQHVATLGLIAVLLVGALLYDVPVGPGAFAAAAVLTVTRLADEKQAIKAVPWNVVLMVCGVTVLVRLLDKTGGIELFTSLIARVSNKQSVIGISAFATGVVSLYSSTSGVVLPAFLPMAPRLVERLGGDPMAIVSAIVVGGHLVDSSPLSTIGALCVAGAGPEVDRRRLFNQALAWGLAMSVVGALLCQVWFGT